MNVIEGTLPDWLWKWVKTVAMCNDCDVADVIEGALMLAHDVSMFMIGEKE